MRMDSNKPETWPIGLRRTIPECTLISRSHYDHYGVNGLCTVWRYQFRDDHSGRFIVYSGGFQGLQVVPGWRGAIRGTVKRQESNYNTTRLSRVLLYPLTTDADLLV